MVTRLQPGRGTLHDSELARLAIAGDGAAFAELYDRHERRVYGFCLRMLGSPEDAADATQETFVALLRRLPKLEGRELNFIAYVLTTARNACYDMIERRRRAQPVAEPIEPPHAEPGDIHEDPERAALLAASREQVQQANATLPDRQREVLALREVEQLSYEEIGEVMDLKANAVAQLISRARIKLRDNLHGTALASIGTGSPECERALPMLAALHDGEDSLLGHWLSDHLATCDTCRLRREAMEEAGTSYRAIAVIVPLIWLREATIARAAEFVGADWSEFAKRPSDPHGSRNRRRWEAGIAVAVLVLVALLLTGGLNDNTGTPRLVAASLHIQPAHKPHHHAAAHRASARHHAKKHAAKVTTTTTTHTTASPATDATTPAHHTATHQTTTTHPTTVRTTTATTTTSVPTTTVTATTTSTTPAPPPSTTTTTSSSSTPTNPFIGPGTP